MKMEIIAITIPRNMCRENNMLKNLMTMFEEKIRPNLESGQMCFLGIGDGDTDYIRVESSRKLPKRKWKKIKKSIEKLKVYGIVENDEE